MAGLEPYLGIAVVYTRIIRLQLRSLFMAGVVNFHASLLPAYRGRHPLYWALYQGETHAGLTVHLVDEKIDHGPVLFRVKVRIRRFDSVASLYNRINQKSRRLFPPILKEAAAGGLRGTPQDESRATCFSSVPEDHFQLDFRLPARTLEQRIWATPGRCYCNVESEKIYILDARAGRAKHGAKPGTILKMRGIQAVVAAGEGILKIKKVHRGKGEEYGSNAFQRIDG